MRRDLLSAFVAVLALTLLFGVAYPLLVTGASQVVFPGKADGSRIERNGELVGSRLLGQDFGGRVRYFQSRPSQTEYAPDATAFSNLGPNSQELRDRIAKDRDAYLARERRYSPGLTAADVPNDAVQTSASGVDPHISVRNARIQAARVAAVRRLSRERVLALVAAHTADRALGVLGEAGVNVLELNLALDAETR